MPIKIIRFIITSTIHKAELNKWFISKIKNVVRSLTAFLYHASLEPTKEYFLRGRV